MAAMWNKSSIPVLLRSRNPHQPNNLIDFVRKFRIKPVQEELYRIKSEQLRLNHVLINFPANNELIYGETKLEKLIT